MIGVGYVAASVIDGAGRASPALHDELLAWRFAGRPPTAAGARGGSRSDEALYRVGPASRRTHSRTAVPHASGPTS